MRQEDWDELMYANPNLIATNPEEAEALKQQFLDDKRTLIESIRRSGRQPNIGDMFNLAIQYCGQINVVKLGETDHEIPDESARLQGEFSDLLDWFTERGVQLPRLSRIESRRWFDYYQVGSEKDGIDGFRTVITRLRPLVHTDIAVDGLPVRMQLAKETVFSIPTGIFSDIMSEKNVDGKIIKLDSNGYAWSENQKAKLERLLYDPDARADDIVHTINTLYLSSLEPIAGIEEEAS